MELHNRVTKRRRLWVLGITVPALFAGGVVAAGGSNAVIPSQATTVTTSAKARPVCWGFPRVASTRIEGRLGKRIGHVSLYAMRSSELPDSQGRPTWAVCTVTWRNGVASGNRNLTRVNIGGWCDGRYYRHTKTWNSPRRSPELRFGVALCNFKWWGSVKYKGHTFYAKPKYFDVSRTRV